MPSAEIIEASYTVTIPAPLLVNVIDIPHPVFEWSQLCGQEITFSSTIDQNISVDLGNPPYPQQVIGIRCKVTDGSGVLPGSWVSDRFYRITDENVDDESAPFEICVKLVDGKHIRDFTDLNIKRSIISGNGVVSTASLSLPNGVNQNDATVKRNDSITVDGGLGSATLPIFQGHRINQDKMVSADRKTISYDFADDYQRLTIDEHTPTDDDLGYLSQAEMVRLFSESMSVSSEYSEGGGAIRERDDDVIKVSSLVTSLSEETASDSGYGTFFMFRDGRVHIKREPQIGSDEPDMVLHPSDVDKVSWSDDDFKESNQLTYSGDDVRYREKDDGHVAANGIIAGAAKSDKSESREKCKEKAWVAIKRTRDVKHRISVQFQEGYRLWPFSIVRLTGFDDEEVNGDWIVQDVSISVDADSYQSAVTLGRELPRFSQFT